MEALQINKLRQVQEDESKNTWQWGDKNWSPHVTGGIFKISSQVKNQVIGLHASSKSQGAFLDLQAKSRPCIGHIKQSMAQTRLDPPCSKEFALNSIPKWFKRKNEDVEFRSVMVIGILSLEKQP